jgi:hypothetical protein
VPCHHQHKKTAPEPSARCGSRFRSDAASRRKCGVCADPAHQLHGLTLVTIPLLREICAASELLYWAARKRIAPRKSARSLRALVLRRARCAGRDRILWRTIRSRNSLSADAFLGLGDFPQHAGWGNRAGAFRKGCLPFILQTTTAVRSGWSDACARSLPTMGERRNV